MSAAEAPSAAATPLTSSTTVSSSFPTTMPLIGLGTYLLPRDQVYSALKSAIQSGYRRIDCAPVYFNEDAIGDALTQILHEQQSQQQGNDDDTMPILQRQDLFVTSKLASPFHQSQHVRMALEKTLLDLRLEYLDLFLIHWPIAFHYVPFDSSKRGWNNECIDDSNNGANIDFSVSIHDTWRAMEDCVDAGLVKYIGVSNFPVMLLHELLTKARIRPFVNQCEAHPYLSQTKLIEYCQARNVQFQAYSPLGTPGYKESHEPQLLQEPIIQEIAEKHNVTPAQVCLAWALQRGTSVVVKSSNLQRQRENLEAMQLKLIAEDIQQIDALNRSYRFFRPEDWWGSIGAVFD